MIEEKLRWNVTVLTYHDDTENKIKHATKHTLTFGVMASDVYGVIRRLEDFIFNGTIEEIVITKA